MLPSTAEPLGQALFWGAMERHAQSAHLVDKSLADIVLVGADGFLMGNGEIATRAVGHVAELDKDCPELAARGAQLWTSSHFAAWKLAHR